MALFSIPIFFVLFREALEAAIIISVLVTLIGQFAAGSPRFAKMATKLYRQVVFGTLAGLIISLGLGAVVLFIWYTYAVDLWAKAELLWEGIFGLIASLMVAATALAMLRGSRMYEKYRAKLTAQFNATVDTDGAAGAANDDAATITAGKKTDAAGNASDSDDSDSSEARAIKSPLVALFWLPFITMLREGLEAVVFIGGVSLGEEPSAIPIAAISGIALGALIGVALHFSGSRVNFHLFFVTAACVLLLMAAGLLSSGIGFLEDYVWSAAINLEADDVGTGAFDPRRSVWHWDCCTPENKAEGGWGLFSSLLGWRNNATISTVTMYCVYWVIVSGILVALRLRESNRAAAKQAAANDEEPVVVAA